MAERQGMSREHVPCLLCQRSCSCLLLSVVVFTLMSLTLYVQGLMVKSMQEDHQS